ncbi:formylglycine-generating enzyme family protein [Caldilinea sp.]|uniref:formylglycine-generating enzyme family protein n=1 Tax=Caldilinea sp. TaxID=2293560 RepID=UPI0026305978|nr:SUMF1/EgtB/PvdO family nonheme iron enzyme [uncultured Caldilinea sp.]
MGLREERRFDPNAPLFPSNEAEDAVAWEYGDDVSFRASPSSASPRAAQGDARALAARRALNHALDEWWRHGALPSDDLLREGLFVLQAGHDLDESQRTLLLRTALMRRRGMLTALRHQTDPERTALVLQEALLHPTHPLDAETLQKLVREDAQSTLWAPALSRLLQESAAGAPETQAQVAPLLAALTEKTPAKSATPPLWLEGEPTSHPRALWLRAALFVLLTLAVVALAWRLRPQPTDMVAAPAGRYVVSSWPDGEAQEIMLEAFLIDRFEATVRQYRACYERGACPWPASPASATRPNYLLDPAFADFPMIHVDHDSAVRFCTFMGKRLPSAAEWEVAAAYSPTTGRMYRYPWGDEFAAQTANSALSGIGDTVQVGSYRPAGDSPLGVSDMAGNVAEWTATRVEVEGRTYYLVRGGSFLSEPTALRTSAAEALPPQTSADWLGVRCARDAR